MQTSKSTQEAPSVRSELAGRAADLRRRSQWGGLFYAFAWAVIAGFGGGFEAYPLLAPAVLLAFLVLAVARMRFPDAPERDAEARGYLRRLFVLLISSAGLLGAVSAWALLDPAFAAVEMVVLLCVISLGTAFAQVYGEDRRPAFIGTALISLPSLVIKVLEGDSWGVVVTMAFHYVYLVGLIQQVHGDARERLRLARELRVERDRFATQSRTDPLTGLANRRSFGFAMQRWSDQPPTGEAAWLLLDLDHFKRINDEFGHPAGDAALVHAGEVLRRALADRPHAAARLGGEEFGVLFRAAEAGAAKALADALCAAMKAAPLTLPSGGVVTLQASGGLAELRNHDDAYRAADAALYRAKQSGRDRVVLAD